eukprot:1058773-Pyramimonas_sp.AAC.2
MGSREERLVDQQSPMQIIDVRGFGVRLSPSNISGVVEYINASPTGPHFRVEISMPGSARAGKTLFVERCTRTRGGGLSCEE